jgi:uncharacterized protein
MSIKLSRTLMSKPHKLAPVAVITIHDACPAFSTQIFRFTDELEKLHVKYNTALVPFFNEKQDLPRFPRFVDRMKSTKGEIVLHGLYHENRRGFCDDFHTRTKAAAEEEIRAGVEILQEIGIKSNVFIPPCWKLNLNSIVVLEKLGFRLVEIMEKYILLYSRTFKKILVPKVLNWDSYGDPEKNIVTINRNRIRFSLLTRENNPRLIRFALHPRDPYRALEDQKEMILRLKDKGYEMLKYSELIPRL